MNYEIDLKKFINTHHEEINQIENVLTMLGISWENNRENNKENIIYDICHLNYINDNHFNEQIIKIFNTYDITYSNKLRIEQIFDILGVSDIINYYEYNFDNGVKNDLLITKYIKYSRIIDTWSCFQSKKMQRLCGIQRKLNIYDSNYDIILKYTLLNSAPINFMFCITNLNAELIRQWQREIFISEYRKLNLKNVIMLYFLFKINDGILSNALVHFSIKNMSDGIEWILNIPNLNYNNLRVSEALNNILKYDNIKIAKLLKSKGASLSLLFTMDGKLLYDRNIIVSTASYEMFHEIYSITPDEYNFFKKIISNDTQGIINMINNGIDYRIMDDFAFYYSAYMNNTKLLNLLTINDTIYKIEVNAKGEIIYWDIGSPVKNARKI